MAASKTNAKSFHTVETACFCLTLTDKSYNSTAEHSNVDAIVVMHIGDDAAFRSRKAIWQPENTTFDKPHLLEFDYDYNNLSALSSANKNFLALKSSFRVKSIVFSGYGNDLVRKARLYTDTVMQIALQLAFLRTHDR
ncbi:hypothetical protein COOONC_00978 [Cooperia oncophora]